MRFTRHPWYFLAKELNQAYVAKTSKYSFLILKHDDGKWYTSWKDILSGGSASSTIEGPFDTLEEAEVNCKRIARALKRKN